MVCLHIFQVCSVKGSQSGDWLGCKYVHAGGVHEMCVIPEYTTDDDKT